LRYPKLLNPILPKVAYLFYDIVYLRLFNNLGEKPQQVTESK